MNKILHCFTANQVVMNEILINPWPSLFYSRYEVIYFPCQHKLVTQSFHCKFHLFFQQLMPQSSRFTAHALFPAQVETLHTFFNPFFPKAPFFYPLKTSENRKVFWCFQGVEKGCIGNEWVKIKVTNSETYSESSQTTKTGVTGWGGCENS